MNIKNIECLALKFRKAIEIAYQKGLFFREQPFANFPRGCCGDTSDLLGEYLLEHGIRTKYVCGTYRYDDFDNIYSHAWLEINGRIVVDITADQFKWNPLFQNVPTPSCYVGERNDFYRLFEVEPYQCRDFWGLDAFSELCVGRMRKLYDRIKQFVDYSETL